MILKEYELAAKKLSDLALDIATKKRPDYTIGNNDVLMNFKRTAERTGTTPLQVWLTFFLKHVDAVSTYCGGATNPSEPINMRFADMRNYLDLGYALIEEARIEAEKKKKASIKRNDDQMDALGYYNIHKLWNIYNPPIHSPLPIGAELWEARKHGPLGGADTDGDTLRDRVNTDQVKRDAEKKVDWAAFRAEKMKEMGKRMSDEAAALWFGFSKRPDIFPLHIHVGDIHAPVARPKKSSPLRTRTAA